MSTGLTGAIRASARDGLLRPAVTGICQASNSTETCGEPSVTLMTTGCEHEHLGTDELCAGCAARFSAADQLGLLRCELCDGFRSVLLWASLETELAG